MVRGVAEFGANNGTEYRDLDGLHKNFVGLQTDGGEGLFDCWVPAEDQRDGTRLGVPHGADDDETISCVRHVQIGKEQVEALGGNAVERVTYTAYRNNLIAVALQRFEQHTADGLVVFS